MIYSAFITNFQSPQDLVELRYLHSRGLGSNLNVLLDEYQTGTEWTVPSDAAVGKVVFFMCAKSSVDYRHMAGVRKQARETGDASLTQFAEAQYALYEKYAGKILAVGSVYENPSKRDDDDLYPGWSAKIRHIILLQNPAEISEFKSFVRVSNTNAITKLDDTQYQSMMRVIERNNPGFLAVFENNLMQDADNLSVPLADEIIGGMTDEEVQAIRITTASGPAPTYSSTVVLRKRNQVLSGIAKRRAKGICQLCMKPAPFLDKNGSPYLETHHIIPLSQNGADDLANMVALCPNCHRKMHMLGLQKDLDMLVQIAASNQS